MSTQGPKRKIRMAGILATTALVVGAAWSAAPSRAEAGNVTALKQQSAAFAEVAAKVTPAVVFIEVEKTLRQTGGRGNPFGEGPMRGFGDELFRRFFGPNMPQQGMPEMPYKQEGQGSGFIVGQDGYIVTNNHVVGEADKVTVTMVDGREFEAKVVGTDPDSDVAVIKVDATGLPTLELGDSDAAQVGEWVLAVGSPFGLQHSVTAGIVSAKSRNDVGITGFPDFIQTDAAINPGNSGGPLVDLDGKVIGLNTAILSRSGGSMGIGFAIPINNVRWAKDQIVNNGSVSRGYLGVALQGMDKNVAESFGADGKGALVADVTPDSPAHKAGLKQGDVVTKLNGDEVADASSLKNKVAMLTPGERAALEVLRDGQAQSLSVQLGERPKDLESVARGVAPVSELGLSVQELDGDIASQLGLEGQKGVVITQVEPGSAAAEAGLERGQLIKEVNRNAISSVREYNDAVKNTPEGKAVLLLVTDGKVSRFVAIRLS